jgi:hypothetical protein
MQRIPNLKKQKPNKLKIQSPRFLRIAVKIKINSFAFCLKQARSFSFSFDPSAMVSRSQYADSFDPFCKF